MLEQKYVLLSLFKSSPQLSVKIDLFSSSLSEILKITGTQEAGIYPILGR